MWREEGRWRCKIQPGLILGHGLSNGVQVVQIVYFVGSNRFWKSRWGLITVAYVQIKGWRKVVFFIIYMRDSIMKTFYSNINRFKFTLWASICSQSVYIWEHICDLLPAHLGTVHTDEIPKFYLHSTILLWLNVCTVKISSLSHTEFRRCWSLTSSRTYNSCIHLSNKSQWQKCSTDTVFVWVVRTIDPSVDPTNTVSVARDWRLCKMYDKDTVKM